MATNAVERTESLPMGRVTVQLELVNHVDAVLCKSGALVAEDVRRVTVNGVVDTGAAHLVIPGSAARQLGVPVAGGARVRYADQRRAMREVVEDVEVHLLGRSTTFQAIVEPDREDVLIGAIVLEALDFIVDCRLQKLVPRDPDVILSEIE